jgi:hypothetical protein
MNARLLAPGLRLLLQLLYLNVSAESLEDDAAAVFNIVGDAESTSDLPPTAA